jgi:hypothetical protein
MALYDRRLIDPTGDELVVTLREAGAAANDTRPGGRGDAAQCRAAVRACQASREGRRLWPIGQTLRSFVTLVWWTDYLGRRHYRVAGGDLDEDEYHQLAVSVEDPRPPLWYVYPDRVFRRIRDGEDTWLAACACGACGPPESLAWMGLCCGPCHDRRQAGMLTTPERGLFPLALVVGPVYAVAISPDGNQVATSKFGRNIRVHDITTGTSHLLYSGDDHDDMRSLAFFAAGRTLAAGDPDEAGVHLFHLDGRKDEFLYSGWDDGEVQAIAVAADGRTVAAYSSGEGVETWERYGDDPWRSRQGFANGTTMAFAPDGGTLALGCQQGSVLLFGTRYRNLERRLETGAPRGHDVHFIAFAEEGKTLLTLTAPSEHSDPDDGVPRHLDGRLQVWDLAGGRERVQLRADLPPITAIAASPDGAWLAWVTHDERHSPAAVTFWDVNAARQRGSLEWNPADALYDLAFSSDGRMLVTGSGDGMVQLWPWRLLLDA